MVSVVTVALLMASAPSASAHAFLVESNPADGATLAAAPAEIRLQFSESVALDAMQLDLVDGAGHHLSTGPVRLEDAGAADADPEEPVAVVAALPRLAPDAYRLSWRTLSTDDLHVTNGVLVFGIGQAVTGSGRQEPLPGALEVILRAIIFLCLALALGGFLACVLLRRSSTAGVVLLAARRFAWLAAVGAAAGIVSVTLLVGWQIVGDGLPATAVINSGVAAHFALRTAGFALLGIAAVLLGRSSGTPITARWAVGIGAVAVAVGSSLMGHPGAAGRLSVTRLLADGAHLLSAATWAGVLFLAVAVALPLARRTGTTAVHATLVAFGPPAAACFGVLLVSGLYLSSSAVVSVDAAVSTFYGRALVLKLSLVAVIAVLGLVNHRRLRDGSGRLRRRLIIAETALAASVLVLAAVLTSSQPAMQPNFVRTAGAEQVALRDGAAGDLQETVTVQPNAPGPNVVLVTASDTRRPSPGPIRRVLVSVDDPNAPAGTPINAEKVDAGQWSAPTDIRAAGEARIEIRVQRDGLPDVVSSYPWQVGGGGAAEATVWTAPIADLLVALAFVAGIALLLAGGWWSVRRLRRRPDDQDPADQWTDGELAEMSGAGR